jgi:hypothetical protein
MSRKRVTAASPFALQSVEIRVKENCKTDERKLKGVVAALPRHIQVCVTAASGFGPL